MFGIGLSYIMPSMFSSEDGDKTASDPNQSNVQNKSKCIWILYDEFVSHCVELSDSDEIPSLQQSGSLDNKETEEKEDIQQLRNQSEQLKKEKDDLEKRLSSIFIEKEDEKEINRLRDEELKNLKISYQQYMNGISCCCIIK